MIGYILRRLAALVLTLLAAALVIFVALEVLPGDPAAVTLGLNAAPEALAALRAEMGLDKPAALRFVLWLGGLATGDLGLSYTYRVPVAQLIAERMAVTLPLALMAIGLATAIGIPLGMLAASRRGHLADAGVMAFAQAGLVDEYQIFIAAKFLGSSARPLLDWPLARMAEAQELEIVEMRAVGNDWRVIAIPRATA